jgi:ribonuclease P protein component
MKRQQRLTKSEQYASVYETGITQVDRFLVLKAKPNHLDFSRFGISVSKKVGNAVKRNKVKRILREILRLIDKKPGWDIVVIARSPSAGSEYRILEKSAANLLARAKIVSSKL